MLLRRRRAIRKLIQGEFKAVMTLFALFILGLISFCLGCYLALFVDGLLW